MSAERPLSGQVLLTTSRMVLRQLTAADAELLVELDSDPAVMHFITAGRPTPLREIEDDVLPCFLRHYEQYDGYGFWAAQETQTGAFLGWLHLRPATGAPNDEPELGYRLRQSAWGKGYATEGAKALVDHAFQQQGAQRVIAETLTVHTGSRRVMEKAGLSLVRTFWQPWPDKIDGDEHGDVEYAIERDVWAAKHRA